MQPGAAGLAHEYLVSGGVLLQTMAAFLAPTWRSAAPLMTCQLVSTMPLVSKMMPEPAPWGISSWSMVYVSRLHCTQLGQRCSTQTYGVCLTFQSSRGAGEAGTGSVGPISTITHLFCRLTMKQTEATFFLNIWTVSRSSFVRC